MSLSQMHLCTAHNLQQQNQTTTPGVQHNTNTVSSGTQLSACSKVEISVLQSGHDV